MISVSLHPDAMNSSPQTGNPLITMQTVTTAMRHHRIAFEALVNSN